jgi:hypothetical protein
MFHQEDGRSNNHFSRFHTDHSIRTLRTWRNQNSESLNRVTDRIDRNQSAKVFEVVRWQNKLAILLTIEGLGPVRRARGDAIDIRWREADDLNLPKRQEILAI